MQDQGQAVQTSLQGIAKKAAEQKEYRLHIPTKMDTGSERWWTAVPADGGHLFQSMVVTC